MTESSSVRKNWQDISHWCRVNKICFFCRASEGKSVEIPYKGDVNNTILDILGGLRSACTYTGAGKLKELPKRTTFIRVTQQTNEIFAGLQSEKQS